MPKDHKHDPFLAVLVDREIIEFVDEEYVTIDYDRLVEVFAGELPEKKREKMADVLRVTETSIIPAIVWTCDCREEHIEGEST